MILRKTLKKLVKLQKDELKKHSKGVKRELINSLNMRVPHILVISGIRRCGKSTLLKQITEKLDNFYYFNFEDPRALDFKVSDFEKLDNVLHEVYGSSNYYLFDEIQNVVGWERFVRKMQDSKKKFVITGSNASMLSRELGTKLTGRHLINELFPFSYQEMLKLKGKKPSISSFMDYFNMGGFPEYLKYDDITILQQVFNDIILRDIVVRYGLKNAKTVKELAIYLLTNIGKEFSYNKLRETLPIQSFHIYLILRNLTFSLQFQDSIIHIKNRL